MDGPGRSHRWWRCSRAEKPSSRKIDAEERCPDVHDRENTERSQPTLTARHVWRIGLLTPRGSRRTAWRLVAVVHPCSPTQVFVAAPARGRRHHTRTAGERKPALTTAKTQVTPLRGRREAGVREAIQDPLGARTRSVSGGAPGL